MIVENRLSRLLLLLFLTFIFCCAFYYLPEQIAGYPVKRIDLFADLREKSTIAAVDTLQQSWLEEDTLTVDSVALQRLAQEKAGIDSVALALRDSLYKALYAVEGADSTGIRIEDYSVGHIGLNRFFTALRNRTSLNRPIRIGFMGDSFIEGDILVADFRSLMQKRFGGRGVGFVPISSPAAQYRPTVKTTPAGWKTWSMLTDQEHAYTLSCLTFEAEEDKVAFSIEATDKYPELDSVSSLKLIYENNISTQVRISMEGSSDSMLVNLPPTQTMAQYEWKGIINKAGLSFSQATGFRALGVAMENEEGVVVDNFSMRGNSGLVLERLDSIQCRALNDIRPYDLIILQYGLNVANDSVMQYGWYGKRMEKVIHHIRHCFPTVDVMLMGVSDRSRQENGTFYTMPSVLALLHAQRQAAKRAGTPFWNTYGAMGGKNSMARYVENNWASKDYTHLGFGGGRQLARILMDALMSEMEFYENAEQK